MMAVYVDAAVSSSFNPHYIFYVFFLKKYVYFTASTAAAAASAEQPARPPGQVMTKNAVIIPERAETEAALELS